MPDMTMTQAAEWAGVTRATIHKAIKSGRLAAPKDDGGVYRINPAELERVYRPKAVDVSGDSRGSSPDTMELITAKDDQIALLRELADKAEATAADLRAERDRLLGIVEATARLLTHQRPSEALPQPSPVIPALAAVPLAPHGLRARLASWIMGR
jgi:excisionase family DNA binding protein